MKRLAWLSLFALAGMFSAASAFAQSQADDLRGLELLSKNKPATASSVEAAGYEAAKAVDGNPATRWSSYFFDPQWIMIDLGKPRKIEAVRLTWEKAFGREYEIQISDDGEDWERIYYTPGGKGGTKLIKGVDETARYVRYYGTARGSNFGHSLIEFEVFGPPEKEKVKAKGKAKPSPRPDPAPPATGPAQVPDVPGWFLTWHDEFDGGSVDLSKWTPDDRNLHKNNELEHYRPDDAIVHEGLLTLRAQKRDYEGQPYTSGLIDTRGKFYQAYGRFEARMKVPRGKGLWPAFWLLSEDATWPPEIDILEFIGHITNVAYMTLHSPGPGGKITQHKDFFGPFFPKDFHVFGVEWEPNEMRFYVDGKTRFTVKEHIPPDRMFIILNLAVGGDWPGQPDDPKVFPANFDVDYVRVWAKDIPGTCVLSAWGEHGRVATDAPAKDRFEPNTTVRLWAHADAGYKFDRWSGDAAGSENPLALKMDGNKRVTAVCSPDPASAEKSNLSLSRGKPAEASSEAGSEYTAGYAFDGKLDTRWMSLPKDPSWISVDLGKTCSIDSVRLIWQDPAGPYFIHSYGTQYEIQVSDDNKTWKTVFATENGNGGTEDIPALHASGRYVRYFGKARHTSKGHVLIEFEVFGKS